jgi:cobalt-zinc-cadmium efflux system outer membrane protein
MGDSGPTQVRWRSGPGDDKRDMSIRHLFLSRLAIRQTSPGWLGLGVGLGLGGLLLPGLSLAQNHTTSASTPARLASAAAPQSGQIELSLKQVLDAAAQNFDVAVARRGVAAAQADVVAADHAPLPILSAKAGSIDLQNGIGAGPLWQQKRIDKGVGLDWTWERGNKRSLRTQATQRSAQAAQADLSDTVTLQRILALQAFYDWLAAQERVEEIKGIALSTQALSDAAQRRLQAGDLSAQDATRTAIEAARARADAQQADLERQRAALVLSQLTALSGNPLLWRARAEWPDQGARPDALQDATARLDDLIEQRPDVQAARERVAAAQASLQLARAQKSSDFTWGGSIDHFPGTSTRQVELRLQMPMQWGYGFEGEIARAAALLDQAQDLLERIRLGARTELQGLLQDWETSLVRLQAYEQDILPRARQVAQQAELAYSQGALTLTDLLDARRTLRATRIESVTARAAVAKAQGAWDVRTAPRQP